MKAVPDLSEYTSGFECGAMPASKSHAPGAPGSEPRWTPSTKVGMGTSYHTSCRLWFTLSHGIINELYYPRIDQPNTRDLQFLVTDGETFCDEERADFFHEVTYPESGALLYRLINTAKSHRYRLIKEIYTEPYNSVLIQHTRLEILDESLQGKLKCFLLIAPHLEKGGWGNSGRITTAAGKRVMHAWKGETHLMAASLPELGPASVGYVGQSDGWQDLRNFRMDWHYDEALEGNIALMAEVFFDHRQEHRLAISLGSSAQSTAAKLMQHLAIPLSKHRQAYVKHWRSVDSDEEELKNHTGDWGSMYRLSRCLLLAHEDKTFSGAMVASLSIPWGESRSDQELGGYHLVWPRDLVQSSMALLATGQTETPRRALVWLSCLQAADGRMPQNSWIDGLPYWKGLQLDEVAAPVLLAWKLHEGQHLANFDPTHLVRQATKFLMLHGPVTLQERWEEASGISPSTLATMIAALCASAQMSKDQDRESEAEFIQDYADWLNRHVEDWTVTTQGDLVDGITEHYVRITPMSGHEPDEIPDPNTSAYWIANGGGHHAARHIVGGDFLQLVRYGIRHPLNRQIRQSIEVTDRILKREVLAGPCYRRYNHDGYGQKSDGSAFDETGQGGGWPLLTGERGHYELEAGHDPFPFIFALETFANDGGMIPEQVWWHDPLDGIFETGDATGAAMPLCWAHAEYLSLVVSRSLGHAFDRVEPAYQRYVRSQGDQRLIEHWLWGFRYPYLEEGAVLRVLHSSPFEVHYLESRFSSNEVLPGLHHIDLDTMDLAAGHSLHFEFLRSAEEKTQHALQVIKKEAHRGASS